MTDREDYCKEEIEVAFGTEMPTFFYIPEEMKYSDLYIDKDGPNGDVRTLMTNRNIFYIFLN